MSLCLRLVLYGRCGRAGLRQRGRRRSPHSTSARPGVAYDGAVCGWRLAVGGAGEVTLPLMPPLTLPLTRSH